MLQYFMLAVLSVASTHVIHNGECPDMKPVENFNMSAYQGVWYEISKYANNAEAGGACASAEYTLNGDIVNVKNTHVINGVQALVNGTARLADDANGTAKLIVTLDFGGMSRDSPLSVVATDYTSYAIAFNCRYDEANKNHRDAVWILARSKTLEGDAKTAVDNFLKEKSKEIDATKLVHTDFSEDACKFNSSSVVTEPADRKS